MRSGQNHDLRQLLARVIPASKLGPQKPTSTTSSSSSVCILARSSSGHKPQALAFNTTSCTTARLQAVCRTIAVTKKGRTRSSLAETELIQLMTELDLLGNNTVLLAETPTPLSLHLANKHMTLAFFDNNHAATGVTTYGKDGQPQQRLVHQP